MVTLVKDLVDLLGPKTSVDAKILEQLHKRGGEATAEELALGTQLPPTLVISIVQRLRDAGRVKIQRDDKLGIDLISF